jgi:hypothetical protein
VIAAQVIDWRRFSRLSTRINTLSPPFLPIRVGAIRTRHVYAEQLAQEKPIRTHRLCAQSVVPPLHDSDAFLGQATQVIQRRASTPAPIGAVGWKRLLAVCPPKRAHLPSRHKRTAFSTRSTIRPTQETTSTGRPRKPASMPLRMIHKMKTALPAITKYRIHERALVTLHPLAARQSRPTTDYADISAPSHPMGRSRPYFTAVTMPHPKVHHWSRRGLLSHGDAPLRFVPKPSLDTVGLSDLWAALATSFRSRTVSTLQSRVALVKV